MRGSIYESPMDRFRCVQFVVDRPAGNGASVLRSGVRCHEDAGGIAHNVIQPGTVMVVDGFHAKDGSNIGSGGHVTLADGKR
jgi:hypothetical protein